MTFNKSLCSNKSMDSPFLKITPLQERLHINMDGIGDPVSSQSEFGKT